MRVIPSNAQYIGKRTSQQDSFGFSNIDDVDYTVANGVVAVLCDGMGGMDSGDRASRMAVQTMLAEFTARESGETAWDALNQALIVANQAVCALAADLSQELGTTLLAALIYEDKLYWVAAGDSRIYLYREGVVQQLTEDHTYGMELDKEVLKGGITAQDARTDPQRHALVSYLGMGELKYINRSEIPVSLQVGDQILLCSDGLFNVLSDEEIGIILADKQGHNLAELLVAAALHKDNPNQDNVTVALLACRGDISAPGPQGVHRLDDGKKSAEWSKKMAILLVFGLLFIAGAVAITIFMVKGETRAIIQQAAFTLFTAIIK
jgi:protein phosphatase